jgi:hypothetical protein
MLQTSQNNHGLMESSMKPDLKRTESMDDLGACVLRKTGKWTAEEDELLKKYVPLYGEKQWRKISEHVPGRTSIQCLHRWTKILKPGLVKGPWTSEEDQKLIAWVKTEGPTKWAQAAAFIRGRSGKQCRERWFNNLNPGVKKGNWSDEEDALIFELYKKHGSSWSKIAKLIPGRTENAIKNRFYSTLRKLTADKKKTLGDINSDIIKNEKMDLEPNSGNGPQHGILYALLDKHPKVASEKTGNLEVKEENNASLNTNNLTANLNNFTLNQNGIHEKHTSNHHGYHLGPTGHGNHYGISNAYVGNYTNNGNLPNLSNPIKLQDRVNVESKYNFNENEDSDNNFEKFLNSIEKTIADDLITKEFESHNVHHGRENDHADELDKIRNSIIHYTSSNISDLKETFNSIANNNKEELAKQNKRAEYEEINNNARYGNKNSSTNSQSTVNPKSIPQTAGYGNQTTQSHTTKNNLSSQLNPLSGSPVGVNSPQFLPGLYNQQKDADILKNGLDMAAKQNLMKTTNLLSTLQNSAAGGDNFNMIYDMISNMMNEKGSNNEQRMVYLFQQLYSLENLLTSTRNELLKLESSLRHDDPEDKKAKKTSHIGDLKFEESVGPHEGSYLDPRKLEDTYNLEYDVVHKKRHI